MALTSTSWQDIYLSVNILFWFHQWASFTSGPRQQRAGSFKITNTCRPLASLISWTKRCSCLDCVCKWFRQSPEIKGWRRRNTDPLLWLLQTQTLTRKHTRAVVPRWQTRVCSCSEGNPWPADISRHRRRPRLDSFTSHDNIFFPLKNKNSTATTNIMTTQRLESLDCQVSFWLVRGPQRELVTM